MSSGSESCVKIRLGICLRIESGDGPWTFLYISCPEGVREDRPWTFLYISCPEGVREDGPWTFLYISCPEGVREDGPWTFLYYPEGRVVPRLFVALIKRLVVLWRPLLRQTMHLFAILATPPPPALPRGYFCCFRRFCRRKIWKYWGGVGVGGGWSAEVFKKVTNHQIFFTIQAYMDRSMETKKILLIFFLGFKTLSMPSIILLLVHVQYILYVHVFLTIVYIVLCIYYIDKLRINSLCFSKTDKSGK